jgi:D-threo-aldose 1-dehydrogenase
MCKRFAEAGDFDCFMIATRSCYTLLQQETLDEFLPLCVRRNISILIGGPYNSGILAKGTTATADFNYAPPPPAILDRVRRLEAVCARHGVPLQAAALQFPLAHPAVVSVVPGARSREQVAQNVAGLAHPIPKDLWAELKAEKLIREDAPSPQC